MRKWLYILRASVLFLFDWLRRATIQKWQFNRTLETFRTQPLILGADLPFPTPWESLYPYDKLIVEIGTGHGETIRHLSSHNRNSLVIGFEKTSKFAQMSAKRLHNAPNAKVILSRAYELLPHLFEPHSISQVYILFPDPWHKKRHTKRRPITTHFFETMHRLLVDGGEIFIATDWPEYFQFIVEELGKIRNSKFGIRKGDNYKPEKFGLVPTHYYEKWQQEKRTFYWIRCRKHSEQKAQL